MDRWALLVGLDHFQGRTRPNSGSVGDVNDMKDALVRGGWRADHIRVLTDAGASAEAIRAGLRWLVANSTPVSFSLFSYSGHVKQQGTTESIWPYDNKLIADKELAGALKGLRGYAWVNISGCEAAGFDEGISSPRRLMTMSSRANEKSYEMPPDYRNSVFSYYLVDQAMNQQLADTNLDRRVSIQEAFRYTADRATPATEGQRYGPQHPVIAGGDGTEWFLTGKPGQR